MLRKWFCIPAALLCLLAQSVLARNVFVTSSDTGSAVTTVTAEPFSFSANVASVAGAFRILPGPGGQKFYVASTNPAEAVVVLEGRFPNVTPTKRLNVGGGASSAAITPDGRTLILGGFNGVALVDTATDTVRVSMGSLQVGIPVDVAASFDSRTAYILTSSQLIALDLTTNQSVSAVAIPLPPAAVTVAPSGMIYVSAEGAIYEISPRGLIIRTTLPVNGTPQRLHFTPNGRFALAKTTSFGISRGAVLLNIAARRAQEAFGSVALRDVAVVNDQTGYAITIEGRLQVLAFSGDGTLSQSAAATTGANPGTITQIAATGDLPSARYLILGSGTTLYRFDTSTLEVTGPVFLNFAGDLHAVPSAGSGGLGGLLATNASLTSPAGAESLPVVVRAYDTAGAALSGVAVQFTTAAPGVSLTTPNTTTNASGYAATNIVVPAGATGPFNVTATAGGRTATFTINVGDPATGGGTGGQTPVATGLQIVTGQGQVIAETFSTAFQEPLTVRLLDGAGNPVPNAEITWSLVEGSGGLNIENRVTDGSGFARANFVSTRLPLNLPALRNVIRARAATGQEVLFYVTTLPADASTLGTLVPFLSRPSDRKLTAPVGSTVPGAIVAAASSASGVPLPFVGLRVTSSNTDPLFGPVATCAGGIPLTDATGVARCDLIITGRPGITNLAVLLGSQVRFDVTLEATPGSAAVIRAIGGNNQTATPGALLQPLTVELLDATGNPLSGTQVTWEFPNGVSLSSVAEFTDGFGRASAILRLPTTPGTYTVRASSGTNSTTFTITAAVAASNLTVVSGNNQTVQIGRAFGQPLTVRVLNAQGLPVSGAQVSFAVTSGQATVSPSTVQTDASGNATATVMAGNAPGPVVVTAASGNLAATFNLTVAPLGPVFTASSFVNAAGFQPGISPGSIAYIRVSGIAPNLRGSVTPSTVVGPLPTRLAGVEVLFNNIPAPIYAVSNVNNEETVIVQVPFEVAPGNASVTIRTADSGSTTVANVQILPVKPGVFSYRDDSGFTYAVATRPDGSYISSANPARRGERIRIYATGLGQTSPATATNRAGIPGQEVASPVIVGINNAGVRLISAEMLEGTVGVYVVTLEIPADTQTGNNQPVGLAVVGADGQAVFASSVNIPII